jgi:ribosome-associated protein
VTSRETAFVLRGEHIALDALLKATGLAQSGGDAKTLVVSGAVAVDGRTELRRGCKLRAGQLVSIGEARIRVLAEGSAA